MSRWVALAVATLVLAAACGIVAAVQFQDWGCGIEGAYFNRSEGAPAYAGVFESDCDDGFSFSDPHLWLGAAIAFALVGVAVLVVSRFRPRPPSDSGSA